MKVLDLEPSWFDHLLLIAKIRCPLRDFVGEI